MERKRADFGTSRLGFEDGWGACCLVDVEWIVEVRERGRSFG
jgi:hypothetical protein